MRTTRPAKPAARIASAPRPPAWPAPTMTNVASAAMPRGPGRASGLGHFDEDLGTLGLDRVGLDRLACRCRAHRPARDMEARLMQRALDAVALDIAVGEEGELVGADVAGGIEDAAELVDRH